MKSTQDIRIDFENIRNEIAQLHLSEEHSFQLALAILEEHGRYVRGSEAANSRANGNNDKPISEKQAKFLQDLGVKELPKTSSEASKKISELKGDGKGSYSARPFK